MYTCFVLLKKAGVFLKTRVFNKRPGFLKTRVSDKRTGFLKMTGVFENDIICYDIILKNKFYRGISKEYSTRIKQKTSTIKNDILFEKSIIYN